eukprot:CAMPEP_0174236012 /NCGR_PEP_ID=MMETSP0417-20130205/5275_1 /TAXON_ID=242541 /ORGANISM="Mayorella sp, Strain BSH-02190019" /LENGTH=65 /DNA_ID=CAMNT_0015314599 /DNA_START=55 /DNA_END=249 /DNA_ORIENTATION=-
MSAWRQAGITYFRYCNMTASYLRKSLKPGPLRKEAMERDAVHQKLEIWSKGKVQESLAFESVSDF